MPTLANRDGVALPLTIFVVTLVTLMLATALVRVDSDRLVAESSGDMVDALTIAQSGLQTYLGTATAPPADGDSVRVNVLGGYADVVAHLVRQPEDSTANRLFIVRSTGRVITPNLGPLPQATRTVAQFAQWQTGRIGIAAAFLAANGLRAVGGGFTTVTGVDACSQAPTVPGVRIPMGPIGSPIPDTDLQGAPPIIESGNGPDVAAETTVDWAATVGGGMIPDYTTVQEADSSWSVQLVDGDVTLTDTWGTGILIVTGNLILTGTSAEWNGVVLVGGRVEFTATTNRVRGLLITGLNEQLVGGNPPRGDIGATTIDVIYDSCFVQSAMQSLTGFVPVANAWVDNWSTY